jgi:hypothetical protein
MKTLQQQDINKVSGGCISGGDGEYYDLIEIAPGMYQLTPCQHIHFVCDLTPAPKEPREPQPKPGTKYP